MITEKFNRNEVSSIVGVIWHPLGFECNNTTFFGVAGHRDLAGHQPVTFTSRSLQYWESWHLHLHIAYNYG